MTSVKPPSDSTVLRHLLLSFPELEIAHNGHEVVDALVEGAIAHLLNQYGASKMIILSDVACAIRELAELTYEPSELVASFERLENRRRLSFRDSSHRSFVFEESVYHAIADSFRRRMASWDTVRAAWIDDVRQRHSLDGAQAEILWEALETFSTALINAHTAEAAAFLYVSSASGQARFYDALSLHLPEVDEVVPQELVGVATVEFPRFFDPSNPARTDYLTSRLRASFFFHLLSVDPSASQLVRDHISEKTLYLDSNFLFRLLGFHGPAMAFAPITALEVSTQLKCRLVVAQETVDEYIRVVRASTARLKATPIHRDAYLRVASSHPSDEGDFMAAYYRDLQSGRVKSVDEFAVRWSNIHVLLNQWGIEIDREAVLTEEEQRSDDFLDQVSALATWQSDKHPDAVTHDVFMSQFLLRVRGRGEATTARTKQWFLTFDRQLTRYCAYKATEAEIPTTILCEDWLQIARPFLPRTDDYARSFVSMLRNPLLYHLGKVPFAHMAGALSRLERYAELPEALVGAMMADEQFIRAFASADRDDDARHLVELKVGELAGETIAQNEELREMLERAQAQSGTLQEHVDTLVDARDSSTRERDELKVAARNAAELAEHRVMEVEREAARRLIAQAEELRLGHEKSLTAAVDAAAAAAASDVEQRLRPIIDARIGTATRWTAFWVGCLGVAVAAGVFLVSNWEVLTAGRVALIAIATVVAWSLLLAIPKGWNVMWTVMGALVSLGAFALGAPDLWRRASPVSNSKEPARISGARGTDTTEALNRPSKAKPKP